MRMRMPGMPPMPGMPGMMRGGPPRGPHIRGPQLRGNMNGPRGELESVVNVSLIKRVQIHRTGTRVVLAVLDIQSKVQNVFPLYELDNKVIIYIYNFIYSLSNNAF